MLIDLKAGVNLLGDSDIHAVTGVLKLYFRELPEPLFSEASYKQFVDSIGMYTTSGSESNISNYICLKDSLISTYMFFGTWFITAQLFLAHFSWKLKWAFLITFFPGLHLSICKCFTFSTSSSLPCSIIATK